mmetsp:Transcript_42065/g.90888  ORF Transcript_42065/g.90888 Transcript_42065/m.90888 type:complete len:306 (-) Transcript_42065:135-1052(-)|eukprot:CAMPEP_0206512772 /NCGR_PEP_ID=MMETSP0324_2-20121206/61104_1 /ASSEMBLY_ACC=CAM_ASM_000836 /TAXON_ID=2866 /ORGANISM="Crypthecodinium cohnii, Strain Seligo" /LENGTH=305 /DNA_ID=CAMNT_0054004845 /DNA_START=43 /DNA_END=960 /DNA_ORIENTATION=+
MSLLSAEALPQQLLNAALDLFPILGGEEVPDAAPQACFGGPGCQCPLGGQAWFPYGPCLWLVAVPILLLAMGLTSECGVSICMLLSLVTLLFSLLIGEFSTFFFFETEGLAYYFAGLKSAFLARGADSVAVAVCSGKPLKETNLFLTGEVDLTSLEPTPALCNISSAVFVMLIAVLVLGGLSVLSASVAALTSDSGREACSAQLASLGFLASSILAIAASITWLFGHWEFASMVDKGFAATEIDPKPKSSVSVSFWMLAETSLVMLTVAASYSYSTATKVKEERDRRRQQEMREHQIVEMRATLF